MLVIKKYATEVIRQFCNWILFLVYREFLFGKNSLIKKKYTLKQIKECINSASRVGYNQNNFGIMTDDKYLDSLFPSNDNPDYLIIAFSSDEKNVWAVGQAVRNRIPFIAPKGIKLGHPISRYYHFNDKVRECLAKHSLMKFYHFDTLDLETIAQLIDRTASIDGCYAEVGVYEGNSVIFAYQYMRAKGLKRDIVAVDTYNGFSYEAASKSKDIRWQETHIIDKESVICRLKDEIPNIQIIEENVCASSLPDFGEIAVLNIDVDLYEATLTAIEQLWPKVAAGGAMVVEDAGHMPICSASNYAVHEYFAQNVQYQHLIWYNFSGQIIVFKL